MRQHVFTYSLLRDRRLVIGLLATLCICVFFWAGSRYPSLQGKVDAGALSALETPLSFERHFEADRLNGGFATRVVSTTLEWLYTNRQGMAFGLVFAALVVTLLPLFPGISKDGHLSPIFRGALLGVPLGVCANCAAPIGLSMMRPDRSPAMGLSLIISSPSFNIIVLSMLLAQFPWYLVAIKLASVVALLLALPLLLKYSHKNSSLTAQSRSLVSNWANLGSAPNPGGREGSTSFISAMAWFSHQFLRNLMLVAIKFVPLMVLAGFLGALVIELFPWEMFSSSADKIGRTERILMLGGTAVVGAFLPVPIAFDIVICAGLIAAGTPHYVVGALLVTLGVFSVYPWMLVGKGSSWKTANMLMLGVIAVGVLGGLAAHKIEPWHQQQQQLRLFDILARSAGHTAVVADDAESPAPDSLAAVARLPGCTSIASVGAMVRLTHCPDKQIVTPGSDLAFSIFDASSAGLSIPSANVDGISNLTTGNFGGIATGDINQDGWPDLAVASMSGVRVFTNSGGHFEPILNAPTAIDVGAGVVALVDLNNDALPELVVGTSGEGVRVFFNDKGMFSADRSAHILSGYDGFINALAFADIDGDGHLDIVIGAAWGSNGAIDEANNRNYIAYNRRGLFELEPLPGPGGETLSMLAHDVDGDGWTDLLVGNDFAWPDMDYKNDFGQLRLRSPTDPFARSHTSTSTMSLDAAARDGAEETLVYSGQIAFGSMGRAGRGALVKADVEDNCLLYRSTFVRSDCLRNVAVTSAIIKARRSKNFGHCDGLGANAIWCALGAWDQIIPPPCEQIPAEIAPFGLRHCEIKRAARDVDRKAFFDSLVHEPVPQRINFNSLYGYSSLGVTDIEEAAGASVGGWSWNSQFIDLDADGYQDILIATGIWMNPSSWSGWRYYRGRGEAFDRVSEVFEGFDLPTAAWVAVDYDRDGDRDIIALPTLLSPLIYKNEASRGRSVEIVLDSACGVRSGVGAKVTAFVGDRKISRWVKASGGYASHGGESVHFGLGEAPHINKLLIELPRQPVIVIEAVIPPGQTTVAIDQCSSKFVVETR
jgi:uncharacterized membrane protein YraQ (UPF0718 family)